MKTVSRGIRLPKKLWDLVHTAEPGLSFSKIVECALEDKYGFSNSVLAYTDGPVVDPDFISDVEYEVDRILSRVKGKGG